MTEPTISSHMLLLGATGTPDTPKRQESDTDVSKHEECVEWLSR